MKQTRNSCRNMNKHNRFFLFLFKIIRLMKKQAIFTKEKKKGIIIKGSKVRGQERKRTTNNKDSYFSLIILRKVIE